MAQLRPEEPETVTAANDVHTTDKSGLRSRKADKAPAAAAPAEATADDANKAVAVAAAAAEAEDDGKEDVSKYRIAPGWKRNVAMVGAWTFIFAWIVGMVTLSQVFMRLYECSSASMREYEAFGIEDPLRYMLTCDLNGAPDLTPFSLPDNPPPFAIPDPMCLPACEREPFFEQFGRNLVVPFLALGDYFATARRIVFILYRIVYRWGYRLYRNISTTL
ncbi:hypothetical protein H9P43_002628 [Blastocladiella emersonii ATCC 22665]|nr:hypothetical protein H9P43_002628 [Blastocladiella emersonii ATCC 22665]